MHPELPGLPPGPAVHLPMFDQQDVRRELRPGPRESHDRGFDRRHGRPGRERGCDRRHGPMDEGSRVVPALTRSVEQAKTWRWVEHDPRSCRCLGWFRLKPASHAQGQMKM